MIEVDEELEVAALTTRDDAHDLGVLTAAAAPCEAAEEADGWRAWCVATGGQDGRVRVWRASWHPAAGRVSLERDLEGHTSAVTCVAWSSCSAALASASLDKTVRLWSCHAWRCTRVLDAHARYVNTVAVSPRLFVTGSNDKTARVWWLRGGDLEQELEPVCQVLSHFATGDLEGIGPAEAGATVETCSDCEAHQVWSDKTSHGGAVNCVAFRGYLLATASSDKVVRLFNWISEEGILESLRELRAHRYPVTAVSLHSSLPLLLSASLDGTAVLWDLEGGTRRDTLSVESVGAGAGGGGGARDARLSPDAAKPAALVASDDHVAAEWIFPASADPDHIYRGHTDAVCCVAWSSCGAVVVTGSHGGDFRLHQAGEPHHTIHVQEEAHDLGLQSCDFASNAEAVCGASAVGDGALLLATGGNDSLARLWLATRADEAWRACSVRACRTLEGHGGNVLCVRFSPTADSLATAATDKHVRVWSVASGRCVASVAHASGVAACALTAERLLIVGCLNGELALWSLPQPASSAEALWRTECGGGDTVRSWNGTELLAWLRGHVLGAPELSSWEDGKEWWQGVEERARGTSLDGASLLDNTDTWLEKLTPLDNGGTFDEKSDLATARQLLGEELQWLMARDKAVDSMGEAETPHRLLCPLTHKLMLQPVKCADGFTYEREAILEWFLASGQLGSPMTSEPLANAFLSPNHMLGRDIRQHLLQLNSDQHLLQLNSDHSEDLILLDTVN